MENQRASFDAMYQKLKQVGSCKLVVANGKHSLKKYTLSFQMDSALPPFYPVTGSAEFLFSYDEFEEQWTAQGQLFGAVPESAEPKPFLSAVKNAIHERSNVQSAFLERALWFAERYGQDLSQFAFKLGLDTSSSGSVQEYDNPRGLGSLWRWSSNRTDLNFNVYFSPPNKRVPFGYSVENRFGFFEPPATHQWALTPDNLGKVRKVISESAENMEKFCTDLSSCLR